MGAIRKSCRLLAAGLAVCLTQPAFSADRWALNDGSTLTFIFTQMGGTAQGVFSAFKADIMFSTDDLENSSLSVEIDTASASTQSKDRDAALKMPAFFDTSKHPLALFKSNQITAADAGFIATGTLTIKGVEVPFELPFSVQIDQDTATARSTFTLDRIGFQVGTGEWAVPATIGHEIMVELDLTATRIGPGAPKPDDSSNRQQRGVEMD